MSDMGNTCAAESSHAPAVAAGETGTFVLQHPGGCTGMFWRSAPKVAAPLEHAMAGAGQKPAWPRNGATLRGVVRDLSTERPDGSSFWLEVHEFRQAGKPDFAPTAGCWMPFEQGGLLLHAPQ